MLLVGVDRAQGASLGSPAAIQFSSLAGETALFRIDFTTVGAVPSGGRIEIEFPAGFDVSDAGLAGSLHLNQPSLQTSGQTATFTSITGNNIIESGTGVIVVFTGVTNPEAAGETGAFRIETFDGTGVSIDSNESITVEITHAAATTLAVATEPSASTLVGESFAQQPVIEVRDEFGNVASTGADSTQTVTADLTTGSGNLSGDVTVAAVAGVATFTDLSIDEVGADKVLTFDGDGEGTAATTAAFEIGAAPSADADLSALTLSAGTLAPAFDAGTSDYTASVTNAVDEIDVLATLSDAEASFTVDGVAGTSGVATTVELDIGANVIEIEVTAEDGIATETYTITVTRAAAGGGGGGGGTTTPPPPTSVTEPGNVTVDLATTTTTTISGGSAATASVTNTNGTASLDLAAGALPAGTTLLLSMVDDVDEIAASAPPPEGANVLFGLVIRATDVDDQVIRGDFGAAVTLTIQLPASAVPSDVPADELVFGFWNGTTWEVLEATVVENADGTFTITVALEHLSLFGVLHQPEAAAPEAGFIGDAPASGIGLLVSSGSMSATDLVTALAADGCDVVSLAVLPAGQWRISIAGADPRVNASFPATLEDRTPFFVRCT